MIFAIVKFVISGGRWFLWWFGWARIHEHIEAASESVCRAGVQDHGAPQRTHVYYLLLHLTEHWYCHNWTGRWHCLVQLGQCKHNVTTCRYWQHIQNWEQMLEFLLAVICMAFAHRLYWSVYVRYVDACMCTVDKCQLRLISTCLTQQERWKYMGFACIKPRCVIYRMNILKQQ